MGKPQAVSGGPTLGMTGREQVLQQSPGPTTYGLHPLPPTEFTRLLFLLHFQQARKAVSTALSGSLKLALQAARLW